MTCRGESANLKLANFIMGLNPEDLDRYGNPTDGSRLINCCFPDCGCDGARLCYAENGPSTGSLNLNVERGSLKLARCNTPLK